MSSYVKHTVLARSYRPTKFADVVGQDHVKNAIQNSILNEKLHSVYLLSGTRGIGKTTIARIFAKAMNCVNYATHKEPCGECPSCISFQEANNPSIIEIDAASRSSVSDTREIIESINFPALVNNYTVYIIDEVHMLTTSSFNALLKTLEEPPPQVKFILCTTDPQKIPATVLSRCLHFHLRPITQEQIANHLMNLLSKENVNYDERAMQLIARLANGSMRDALSLTEQAIALGENEVSLKIVQQMVGMVDDVYAINMCIAILNSNAQAAFDVLKQVKNIAPDWRQFVCQILEAAHIAALLPFLTDAEKQQYVGTHDDLIAFVKQPPEQTQNLVEVTQVIFEIFTHALKQLEVIGNAEQVIHLSIIRAIAFTVSTEYVGNFELLHEIPQQGNVQANEKKEPHVKKLRPNRYDSGIDNFVVDRTAVNGNNVNNHIRHLETLTEDVQEESLSILDTIPGNTVPNKHFNPNVAAPENSVNINSSSTAEPNNSLLDTNSNSFQDQIVTLQTSVNQPSHNFTTQVTSSHEETNKSASLPTTVAQIAGVELKKRVADQKNEINDNQIDLNDLEEITDLTSDQSEASHLEKTDNSVDFKVFSQAKLPQDFSFEASRATYSNLESKKSTSTVNFASLSTSSQELFVTESSRTLNDKKSIIYNEINPQIETIVTDNIQDKLDTGVTSPQVNQNFIFDTPTKTSSEELAELIKTFPKLKQVLNLKLSVNIPYHNEKAKFGYNLGKYKSERQVPSRTNSDKDFLVIPYNPSKKVLIPATCDLLPPTRIPYQNSKLFITYITPNNFRAVGRVYLDRQPVSHVNFVKQLAHDLISEAVENDKLFKLNKFYINLPRCLEQVGQALHKSQQIIDLLSLGLQESELRFLKNTNFNLDLAAKTLAVVDASNLMAGIEPRDYITEIERIALSKGLNFIRVPIDQKNNFESYSLMSIAQELLEDYLYSQYESLLHDEQVLITQARAFFGVNNS